MKCPIGSGLPTPRSTPMKDFEDSRGGASGQHWRLWDAGSGSDVTFSSGTFIRQEVG